MITDPLVWGVVGLVGMACHEGCHYLTARAVGARAKPTFSRGKYTGFPNPAIRLQLRDLTPETLRLVALSPLLLMVPAVAIMVQTGLTPLSGSLEGGALFMWLLCALPSPPDFRAVWYATDLEFYHEVWYGTHDGHAAAEGIY